MAPTKGHLANNGGIRGHSAGDVFPWIAMQVGHNHGVLTPAGWFIPCTRLPMMQSNIHYPNTHQGAEDLAADVRRTRIKCPMTYCNYYGFEHYTEMNELMRKL